MTPDGCPGFDRREVPSIQAASTNDRSSCRECMLRSGHEGWPALRRGLRRSRPPDQLTAGVAMRPPQAQRLGAVSHARRQQGIALEHSDSNHEHVRLLMLGLPGPGLLLLGMMLQSPSLALAASAVILLTAVISPRIGLVELAIIAPVVGRPIIPYPGLLFVLIAAIVIGSLYRLPLDRPRLSIPLPLAIVIGFMLFVTVQQLPAMMAGYTGSAQGVGSVYLRYLTAALAAVAAGWVVSRRAPYPYLGGLLIGGVLVSLLSILMYAQPSLMGALGDLIAPSDQVARPAGAMSDPNYFGMVAATMLVIAFGWLLVTRERVQRVLLLVVMVELGAGLAVSQSRSAFIALGLGLVVVAFTHSRRTGLVTTGLVATAGALLAPLLIQWRLTNTGGVVNALTLSRLAESDAGRLDLVLEGPRLFLQSPVFGVGLGEFVQAVGDASHNLYSVILAEQGIVGVILVVSFGVALLGAIRRREVTARAVGLGVLSILSIGAFFLEPTLETSWSVPAAIVLTLVLAADWQTRQEKVNAPNPPRPKSVVVPQIERAASHSSPAPGYESWRWASQVTGPHEPVTGRGLWSGGK